MSSHNAIYSCLDFSINANNDPIPSTLSGTTLSFGEIAPSEIIKRAIEDVSPSDSTANVDTSVSVESPVQKAPRRSLEPRGSSRRKQAEKRL